MTDLPAIALPAIEVDQISLPVATPAEATRAVEAMHATLAQLFAQDRAAGIAWRSTIDAVSLDLPRGRSEDIGVALARALRERLAIREGEA